MTTSPAPRLLLLVALILGGAAVLPHLISDRPSAVVMRLD